MANSPVSAVKPASATNDAPQSDAKPHLHQQSHEIQSYGQIVKLPNALPEDVCKKNVELLNQVLADTITLRHVARSREGFAQGALRAAKWLAGKKGFYEFSEIAFH